MRLTIDAVAKGLFADLHRVKTGCIVYRVRAIARRMLQFGYEDYVNTFAPRELVMMAAFMPDWQHNALVREAHRRGDATLRAWLEAMVPEVFDKTPEVAHV